MDRDAAFPCGPRVARKPTVAQGDSDPCSVHDSCSGGEAGDTGQYCEPVLYHLAVRELARDTGRSLWGYGPESFYFLGLTTEFMLDGVMHTVKVESCDSAVVELMMDTGYVGLLLVAALFGSGAVLGFRQYPAMLERSESAYPPLLAGLVAFIFLMTNVELFGWGQQTYMLWIILAMMMKGTRAELQESKGAEGESELAQSAEWSSWHPALQSSGVPEGNYRVLGGSVSPVEPRLPDV